MTKQYPEGDSIHPASVRGESILLHYQKQAGGDATAADLIADVLAFVETERAVAHGEALAEGEYTSGIDSPESVIDEAQASLEHWIAEYKNHQHLEG